ncbi:MAG: PcfJ domain-containing protein [Bacillota bacterium]|nr:PcfJ domain-containing protein [Bacillota bacterium]
MLEDMKDEELEHFPKGISDDIEKYATDYMLKFSRYIFTHRQGKQQYGYCTHCHSEFKTEGLRHNEETVCPDCKSKCKVKASGRGRKTLYDEAYFVYYEKSVKNPNAIIARGIYAIRNYTGDYHHIKTKCSVEYYYLFEIGNSVMFRKHHWPSMRFVKGKVHSNFDLWDHGNIVIGYCRDSIRKATKDTPFRYSTWESYDHKDMTEFFDLYAKYPKIEYLTKEGFKSIVEKKLDGYPTYRAVNWRGKTIFKILKIDKQDLKELKSQKVKLTFDFLKVFQDAKKHKWNLSTEEVVRVVNKHGHYYDTFVKLTELTSMKKLLNYFSKQYKDYNGTKKNRNYYSEDSVLLTYKDYIADCKKLNMNIKDEHVLFPKDLYSAHQNTLIQVKINEDGNKKYDQRIEDRVKELQNYVFQYNELQIRPAVSSKELVIEGTILHHCVAAHYTESYANGKTTIFLIRKVAEPDKPYFTMEMKDNKIIQVRGLRNCNPGKDVSEFVEAFKATKLQIKKSKAKIAVPA